jgi:hypothetical protein
MMLVARADQEQSFDAVCVASLCVSVGRAILNARYYNSGNGQFLSEDRQSISVAEQVEGSEAV